MNRLQMKEEESEMKKYAKLLGLVLALAMAFSLMATGSAFAADDAKPELPEFETVTPGTLTVATSPDFAPYEFYAIVDGEPVLAGFDVALAGYIADYLGLVGVFQALEEILVGLGGYEGLAPLIIDLGEVHRVHALRIRRKARHAEIHTAGGQLVQNAVKVHRNDLQLKAAITATQK